MVLDQNWFSEIDKAGGTAFSLRLAEPSAGKVHEEQSPFQKIAIYQTDTFGYLMTIDGFTMLSTRDNFIYHEMMSHPALYTHPDPKNVVIIGGGDCGTLQQVLRHADVHAAVQVDIDERVTRLSERYFPELCSDNDDPRATLLFDDGIAWMKNAAPGSVDVIIVDSTDPVGPAQGLFNEAFYRSCIDALGDDGILVQQSESPFIHQPILVAMHDAMRHAGFAATQLLSFPQPIYPSGWWSATLAFKNTALTPRWSAAANPDFETLYYSDTMHQAALAMPPFVKNLLEK